MKRTEFDRIFNEFNNEINRLHPTISKNNSVKTRLKYIYDSTKQNFVNAINENKFKNIEEFRIYLNNYSCFLQRTTHYFFKLNCLNKHMVIGISGSTAKNLSDINSDLDLVISPIDLKSNIDGFNNSIISELTDFFSTNIDLVQIEKDKAGLKLTEDIIDRLIAFTPQILFFGDSSYSSSNLSLNVNQLNQTFFDQLLLSFMPIPPDKKSNDIKYRKGGLRDIIFLLENIGRLNIENKDGASKRMRQIEFNSTRNYLLLKMNGIAGQLSNEETEKIISQTIDYKNEIIKFFLEKRLNIPYSFYTELLLRNESRDYYKSEECKKILISQEYQPLKLLILSTTMDAFNIIKGSEKLSKRVAYSLVANRYTPSHILHELTLNKGYEWRNVRDQVLKHQNVSVKTIHLLANDDMEYTRNRAKSLIN